MGARSSQSSEQFGAIGAIGALSTPTDLLNACAHPLRATGGPIQLWEFLLELLLDPSYNGVIAWTEGTENSWEFRLIDTEAVAILWGTRKNKPRMNYEKLARGNHLFIFLPLPLT